MSRLALALALASGVARADVSDPPPEPQIFDQGIGGAVGIAGGGHVTPGGLRIEGHYTYQLTDRDWSDATAAFTFGGGGAACFRDRGDEVICDHDFLDGRGVEVVIAVRRYFDRHGAYKPFARLGVGIGIARYGDDSVTGLAIPIHAGGGVRAAIGDGDKIAVVVGAELVAGVGFFNRGMGAESQLGIAITAGAELPLP
jgi:hypothetical protein